MKISRNAPCPCGSGQKYKHCCISGTTNDRQPLPESQELFNAIRAEVEAHPHSSIEDLQSVATQQAEAQNNRAHDDFEGLSPRQMGTLLDQLPGREKLVQFATLLDAPTVPVIRLFELLEQAISGKGLKATEKGNLPRAFCRHAALEFHGEKGYADLTRFKGINSEPDFQELHVMRICTEMAGLVKKRKSRFLLSSKAKKLLDEHGKAGIYLPLLNSFAGEYNWGYTDRYPEIPFIQHSWMFTLWLLHRHGNEKQNQKFYEEKYIKAFPVLLEQVEGFLGASAAQTIKEAYALRTFDRFLALFGLVECTKYNPKDIMSNYSIKATPLLSGLVTFSD